MSISSRPGKKATIHNYKRSEKFLDYIRMNYDRESHNKTD